MRKQIESRDDLTLLVTTFYDKIKADEGNWFFFNEMIEDGTNIWRN
jgi:hemoglobin